MKNLALKLLDKYDKRMPLKIMLPRALDSFSLLIMRAPLEDLQDSTAPHTSDAERSRLLYLRRRNKMRKQLISIVTQQLPGLLKEGMRG